MHPAVLSETGGERLYQVVVFGSQDARQVGLVETVFRGSMSKKKVSEATATGVTFRHKRLNPKPVVHELDIRLASKVLLVQMSRCTETEYRCACTSVAHCIDPLCPISGVKAQLPVQKTFTNSAWLHVQFRCPIDDILKTLSEAEDFPSPEDTAQAKPQPKAKANRAMAWTRRGRAMPALFTANLPARACLCTPFPSIPAESPHVISRQSISLYSTKP